MQKYKLYIFDMDLTTVDSVESSILSYTAGFKAIGLDFDKKDVFRYLNMNLYDTYKELEDYKPGAWDDFLNGFLDESSISFNTVGKFYPECAKVFEEISSRGAIVCFVTNRSARDIQLIIDNNPNIKKFTSYFVGSDMVSNLKPDPEGIYKCMERYNIPKSETIYVGDSRCDYEASLAAGIDFAYIDRYNNGNVPEVEGHKTLEVLIK